MSKPSRLENSFGYQQVDNQERERRIRDVFNRVASRYDLMNDVMSFGIHRLWKHTFASMVTERSRSMAKPQAGQVLVDLAGGTGDIARQLAGDGHHTLLVDPSLPMMQAGHAAKPAANIRYLAATGENLPLRDNSVDVLTIAFGIRNMTRMETALSEIVRVLKPGGYYFCLEFSRPHWLLKPFYDFHSFHIIPRLGAWISHQPAAYTYLVESIRRFPDQQELCRIMQQAGLEQVSYRNLSFGIACIHSGVKPGKA
ncbi:MAG: class I SAM-dependent methyltransferase [Gammaproteobacteria bacterium]|nr:class I SAM-dependent methyltransferase [Gammaproteobacteria bacterium]MBU1723962.1 class I SAM-dependent methyltransferase [Gammaproteobacteria bacterium]MBU2007155.1 class I SAM-dependent methyltransferase [Gammaproteobacteria bacterium]